MSICAAPAACVRGRGATTPGTRARFCRRCSPAARWRSRRSACSDVAGFVGGLTGRYRPRTVELAASSLRSFFRFLRAAGLRERPAGGRGPDGAASPGRSCPASGPRALGAADRPRWTPSSPRGLRDRAIILCVARLGLRASEVVQLRLEDLDWRNASVRVRARKTGHGALLPLTARGGGGAGGLPAARPPGHRRRAQVFVLHRLRAGAPISQQHRRPCRGQRAAACGHGRAGTRGEPAAPFTGHRSARPRGQPAARSLTCSGTPRWPRPGSTPRSMSRRCARSRCPGRRRRHDRRRRPRWSRITSTLRRGLGYRSPSQERALRAFARYLDRDGHDGPIPLEASLDWAASTALAGSVQPGPAAGDGAGFPASPVRAGRCHRGARARDCSARPGTANRRTCIPTARSATCCTPPPGWRRPAGCGRTATPRLFGLLACTGLRISEALALTCGDVDLDGGMLTVRAGKRGRTRLVPLHPSALPPLRDYAAERAAPLTARPATARRSSAPTAATGSATTPPTARSSCCAASWAGPRPAAPARRACTTCGTAWWCGVSRPGTPRAPTSTARSRCWRPTSVTWRCVTSTGTCRPSPS